MFVDLSDELFAFGHIEFHNRFPFAEVTFVKVDIEHTGIGDNVEVVTEVSQIAQRAPLSGGEVRLTLYRVEVRDRSVLDN